MRPAVVCHLRPSNWFGGPEKQIFEQSLALAPDRWQAVVGSFLEGRSEIDLVSRAQAGGIPTFLLQTRSPFSPAAISQLRTQLRKHRVDLLVTHGYKADLIGYWATRGTSVPLLVCIRGYTGENLRVRFYEWIDKRLLVRVKHVLAVSEMTRRIVERQGVPPGRVSVIHNGVRIPETPVTPADLRGELGLPSSARIVMAVGRLSTEKGHRYLVEATRHLVASRPDVHVVLVGEGRERPSLELQVRQLQLTSHIHFAGFRRDVLSCIQAAELVVNPSLTEGSPNIVLETLSVGKPVVATEVGGVPEILSDHETGWLVPPSNPLSLARAVEDVLDHPEQTELISRRGHDAARQRFSFESQAKQLMELYDATLEQR